MTDARDYPEAFLYPEDRGEIFGDIDEEEAHLIFTIQDFEFLLEDYGVNHVLNRLTPTYRDLLLTWIDDASQL